MIITRKNNYFLIDVNENSFNDFFVNFEKKYAEIDTNNIIINFLSNFSLDKSNILLFSHYINQRQENNKSFIVVIKDVEVDDFPETFNIVPTLQEAEDVLEMEEIQRDLGF